MRALPHKFRLVQCFCLTNSDLCCVVLFQPYALTHCIKHLWAFKVTDHTCFASQFQIFAVLLSHIFSLICVVFFPPARPQPLYWTYLGFQSFKLFWYPCFAIVLYPHKYVLVPLESSSYTPYLQPDTFSVTSCWRFFISTVAYNQVSHCRFGNSVFINPIELT